MRKVSKTGLRILGFLKKHGGIMDIHEFWRFYYGELGSDRSKTWARLLKGGFVKYNLDGDIATRVVLTDKGEMALKNKSGG